MSLEEENTCKVVFVNEDGTVLSDELQILNYGEHPIPPQAPKKAPTEEKEFVFVGWFDQYNNRLSQSTVVYKDTVYTANYKEQDHIYKTISIKKASCSKDGFKQQKCVSCSYERQITIPKRLHNWEEIILQEPTCTEPGLKSFKCINEESGYYEDCDEVQNGIEIPSLGHACKAANIARTESALRRGAIFKCVRDGCDYQYTLYFQNKIPMIQPEEDIEKPTDDKDRDSFIRQVFHFGADETKAKVELIENNGQRYLKLS